MRCSGITVGVMVGVMVPMVEVVLVGGYGGHLVRRWMACLPCPICSYPDDGPASCLARTIDCLERSGEKARTSGTKWRVDECNALVARTVLVCFVRWRCSMALFDGVLATATHGTQGACLCCSTTC